MEYNRLVCYMCAVEELNTLNLWDEGSSPSRVVFFLWGGGQFSFKHH